MCIQFKSSALNSISMARRGSVLDKSFYVLSGFTSILREEQARATDEDLAFLEKVIRVIDRILQGKY